jgi:prepilin-type processing-associated H-X9-DG protein
MGMTLLEAIVVISLIGILLSLGIPAVLFAIESSRRTACLSNSRQLALMLSEKCRNTAFLPENRLFVSNGRVSSERLWWNNSENHVSNSNTTESFVENPFALFCPSAPRALELTGMPAIFNGNETTLASRSSDYVGNAGINSVRTVVDNLEIIEKRRGYFAELISPQPSLRKEIESSQGSSNTVVFWESIGGKQIITGRGTNSQIHSDWNAYFDDHSFVLSGDGEPILRIGASNKKTAAKYLVSSHGFLTGRVGLLSPSGLPMDAPNYSATRLLADTLINVSNVSRAPISRHGAGCSFAMADGSVRFVANQIGNRILFALVTIDESDNGVLRIADE